MTRTFHAARVPFTGCEKKKKGFERDQPQSEPEPVVDLFMISCSASSSHIRLHVLARRSAIQERETRQECLEQDTKA